MTKWESPAGIEFIQLGVIREGYSICASGLTYSDYGSQENLTDGAFGPPTIQQPGGPGTSPLTIIRVTTDGRVRNAMTFTKDNNEKDVNIKHKVTNLTSSSLTNVRVTRMFDGDRSRFVGGPGEFWRRSADSVWDLGAPDDGTDHGLILEPRSISFSQNPDSAVTTFDGADGCSPPSEPTPIGGGGADYEGHLTMSLATLGAGVRKQALYRYGRM